MTPAPTHRHTQTLRDTHTHTDTPPHTHTHRHTPLQTHTHTHTNTLLNNLSKFSKILKITVSGRQLPYRLNKVGLKKRRTFFSRNKKKVGLDKRSVEILVARQKLQ